MIMSNSITPKFESGQCVICTVDNQNNKVGDRLKVIEPYTQCCHGFRADGVAGCLNPLFYELSDTQPAISFEEEKKKHAIGYSKIVALELIDNFTNFVFFNTDDQGNVPAHKIRRYLFGYINENNLQEDFNNVVMRPTKLS
jgi:hypothetical protein